MASAHAPYPAFSLECIRDLITIVRNREVRSKLPELAKCVYELTGAALGATIGEPEEVEPLIGALYVDEAELEEAKAALEEAQGGLQSFGTEDSAAIDPATVALLIQLAVKLIEQWLSRRNS